jgi:RNA polymerase sigma-70 factor (ECF subfamily)
VSKEVKPKAAGKGGPDDARCVRATLAGDLTAFEALVERYERRALTVAYGLLNNRDDAMEVTQDAFLQAFRKLGTLARPGRFGPWLLRIVSNLSLNRRRSRALRRAASLEGATDSDGERAAASRPDPRAVPPPEAASGGEVEQLIAAAIDELPELQRTALVLFSIQGMPQREVAEIMGCSVEAVKWHVFTARKKLKEILKDYL